MIIYQIQSRQFPHSRLPNRRMTVEEARNLLKEFSTSAGRVKPAGFGYGLCDYLRKTGAVVALSDVRKAFDELPPPQNNRQVYWESIATGIIVATSKRNRAPEIRSLGSFVQLGAGTASLFYFRKALQPQEEMKAKAREVHDIIINRGEEPVRLSFAQDEIIWDKNYRGETVIVYRGRLYLPLFSTGGISEKLNLSEEYA